MILWGFRKGERLDAIQVVGFVAAVIGLVVTCFSRIIGATIDWFHLDAGCRRRLGRLFAAR